ncbi:MAG TPA: aspartyl/asparaginyl beta-hydroxylase domain-containing protein [Thermoanaerobaculia bacterium]|nr:aspartyl/asparaginyl beta-hydroxylase domain-containing protein [Thermoanaerobaculia bacterium]
MDESDFEWDASYVIPAGTRFRSTPAGALQVDGEGADDSVEVPRAWVELYLAFARPQSAAEVLRGNGRRPRLDREDWRQRVAAWSAQGLLRRSGAGAATPARLALFAQAAEEFYGGGARRFPLRSPFALQRPVVFYPGLATLEIHDRRRFPWVAALEAAFPVIRRELLGLLSGEAGFATVHRTHTSSGEWAAAYLWAFGEKVDATCRACPETVRALGAIPGVAQFGTTLYSALAPRTQIAPHHGYSNAKLRCQLPLLVPGGCKLKVGDQEVEQQEGRCIVFDDSFLHSAWNDSAEPRFVLVFDFFHPDLTVPEIVYLSSLAQLRRLGKGYLGDAAAGKKVDWVGAAAGAGEDAAGAGRGRARRGKKPEAGGSGTPG